MSATLDRQALTIAIERLIQTRRETLLTIATNEHDRLLLARQMDTLRNAIIDMLRGDGPV